MKPQNIADDLMKFHAIAKKYFSEIDDKDCESNESAKARYFTAKENASIQEKVNKFIDIRDMAGNRTIENFKFKLSLLTKEYIEEHLGRDNAKQHKAHSDIVILTEAIAALK